MRGAGLVVTVEVFFVVLEGEGAVVLPEPDDGGDVLGVLVGEALHQDLLVGPPRPDLQPLQVEQLLEDAPLDLVPEEDGQNQHLSYQSGPPQNWEVLGLAKCDKNSLSEVILDGLSDGNRGGF